MEKLSNETITQEEIGKEILGALDYDTPDEICKALIAKAKRDGLSLKDILTVGCDRKSLYDFLTGANNRESKN